MDPSGQNNPIQPTVGSYLGDTFNLVGPFYDVDERDSLLFDDSMKFSSKEELERYLYHLHEDEFK